MNRLRLIAFRTLFSTALFLSLSSTTFSQDGPPPEVRDSIDSVVKFLTSEGAGDVDAFLRTSLASVDGDKTRLKASLLDLRKQARGKSNQIAVEAEPDGLLLVLGSSENKLKIKLNIGENGITKLEAVGNVPSQTKTDKQSMVRSHTRAMEAASKQSASDVLQLFDKDHFAKSFLTANTPKQREALINLIQEATRDIDGAQIVAIENSFVLKLLGPQSYEVRFKVEDQAPWKITSLQVVKVADETSKISITIQNLKDVFSYLEKDGYSGVAYVKQDGKVKFEKAFGSSNESTRTPMLLDTAFCIGSTPIDFTIAAIYKLEADNKLSVEDPISKHFQSVPADKSTITISHLMSGRSGLPDFHHIESDSDPDLAWIDRAEAERRIFSQKLLFKPGTQRAHSHSAFVLLAALIEHLSGKCYVEYLTEHFFKPAQMQRTGLFGELGTLKVTEFAVGGGPSVVGSPNIPPNWGKTSWLVMGSGGMYSTLPDLRNFFRYVRSLKIEKLTARFSGRGVGIGGSDRGYYVLHVFNGENNEAILMLNADGVSPRIRDISKGIEQLIQSN